MERRKFIGETAARAELGESLSKPSVPKNQHSLPFEFLTFDEFEIFCYLLLIEEHPNEEILYYGKTSDGGRDIVWIKTDGSVELIQCKHFGQSIDISKIKPEIAKLYSNIHSKSIPERPVKVTFYVVPDLTPQAKDLLRQPEKWKEIAASALEKHLRKPPDQDVLEFSLSWILEFAWEPAIRLSKRAKKHQSLIDEFFGIEKVIDANDPKLEEILSILKSNQVQLQPNFISTSTAMQDLIHEVEKENPGITFTVASESNRTSFTITANSSVESVDFGTLIFPANDRGRQGLEKFRSTIEEGYACKLEPGEYEWDLAIKLPEPDLVFSSSKPLDIYPTIPDISIPIELAVIKDEQTIAFIRLTYLHLIRTGTHEIEFLIEGGQLTGKMFFVSRPKDRQAFLTVKDLDLSTVPALKAKNSISFMYALFKGGKIRVISLNNERILLEDIGVLGQCNISDTNFEDLQRSLDCLIKINRVFDVDLRYPGNFDDHTAEVGEMIISAIESGQVIYLNGIQSFPWTKQEALQVIKSLESDEPFAFSAEGLEISYDFLGHVLPMGENKVVFENVTSVENLSDLREAVQALSETDGIQIDLQYERAVVHFSQWFLEPN